jgi:hypothetical protein
VEKIAVGGRPLQTTVNDDKQAMIFERCMELIMQVQTRLFDSLQSAKIVTLFRLGEGTPPKLGLTTDEIVAGFYSFLGFTRLVSDKVVAKAVAAGVEKRLLGYIGSGAPALGADGKYQVTPAKVRFGTTVAEDEIDLESGFVMVPQAIPVEAPAPVPGGGSTQPGSGANDPARPGPIPPGPTPPVDTPQPGAPQTSVLLSFTADRDKVYGAWNAIANLADMAGHVTVTVKADKLDGFDKGKLANGVIEPLREADLIE